MPIKYVTQIPTLHKTSKFDETINSIVKMLDKDPTKTVEVTGEGAGLMARFKAMKKDGSVNETIKVVRRGDTFYFSAVE